MNRRHAILALSALFISACTTLPSKRKFSKTAHPRKPIVLSNIQADGAGREIVMYAMGLLNVNYRFGGNNPEAGLDCSGMIVYIYKNALGVKLPRTAAGLAAASTPIPKSKMRVGDLVFFNTLGRPYSHVGLYIGGDKFIHAPHSNSTIRVAMLSAPYYMKHFEEAHTFFAPA